MDPKGFIYAAKMTNALASEVPERVWDKQLIAPLGTLRELFLHIVRVRDVYRDGLRTGEQATAQVRLTRGAGLRLESSTLVRFLPRRPDAPAGPGVEVLTGAAVLEAGADGFDLITQIGLARLDPGSRVRLEAMEDGIRFDVLIGAARLETADGTVDVGADAVGHVQEPGSHAGLEAQLRRQWLSGIAGCHGRDIRSRRSWIKPCAPSAIVGSRD